MNIINYWNYYEADPPEAEAPEAPEPPGGDDNEGDSSGGNEASSTAPENKPNINSLDAESEKAKVINIVNYFMSALLADKMYFSVNKIGNRKFLSTCIDSAKELLKQKIMSVFSSLVKEKMLSMTEILSLIDTFDFTREKTDDVDNVYLLFNKKKILQFFFEKRNRQYFLNKTDLVTSAYTRDKIRDDIYKFISELVKSYKGKQK